MSRRAGKSGFGFVSVGERRAADRFFADLVGMPRVRPRPRGEACDAGHGEAYDAGPEIFAGEALVGQADLGTSRQRVDASAAALRSGLTLHAAIQYALTQRTSHTLITGGPLDTGSTAAVHTWGPPTSLHSKLAISFDATNVAVLLLNGGQRVYFQANPLATTPTDRLPWVHVPGLHEFLTMPAAQQTSQRNEWVGKIVGLGLINPTTSARFTRAELTALPTPALRLMLAHNAAAAFPIVNRPRGGVLHGVTLPRPVYPVVEPRVYLRVISMAEGKMESINAWDVGAGISPGPIQLNAIRGFILKFLWKVWEGDRALFQRHFGAPLDWEMRSTGGVPELRVTVGTAQHWLSAQDTVAEVRRVYAYFQSGDPAHSATSQIDRAFRRDIAGRMRNVIAWPHIQEMLEETSGEWLEAGLAIIRRAGIPALNASRPDRETFVLKSLLMSTYVRFSSCLRPLLDAMATWPTVSAKLANWRTAVATMAGACSASGDADAQGRNAILVRRLGHQEVHAGRVFADLEALRTAP